MIGVHYANRRFAVYTTVTLVIAIMYVFAGTIGTAVMHDTGSRVQSYLLPVLDEATVVMEIDGEVTETEMPAFQITRMKWEKSDLLLWGQMCKVEPYEFVSLDWGFGTPDLFRRAIPIYPEPQQFTRQVGCQYWGPWRLLNAKHQTAKTFFGLVTSRPGHGQWLVYYRLGPFPFPPADFPEVGDVDAS